MDDIDALEVDEEELALSSPLRKRSKSSSKGLHTPIRAVQAPGLVPDGWPGLSALHNAARASSTCNENSSFSPPFPAARPRSISSVRTALAAHEPSNALQHDPSGGEMCTLPGPAGKLQHAMMSGQPFELQLQPHTVPTSTIRQTSAIMDRCGGIFSSSRWQAAVNAAGQQPQGTCSLATVFHSRNCCTIRRALPVLMQAFVKTQAGAGYALLKDPTCARGVEASIHCKLLSKPGVQEGSVLVLKQVNFANINGNTVLFVFPADLLQCF
ncbi:hypothetical protein CVIRNUC_001871 [Coccomyxa viridis]|uniref:Uncharacterized protein n=1 Tax=Coccomyxa viridis TaxID=1274662 RepID=A0AAV1HXV1_9CHLO|nr:hypothetical protein CVIRNUC_001871 [Coccomyxa viridis]